MARPLRVLIVEDSPDDAELMLLELRRGGFDPSWQRIETAAALRDALAQGPWEVVLWDYTLPGFDAMAALAQLNQMSEDLPFIVVTGSIGEEQAVRLMKAGADDYLLKGNLARLAPAVERTLRKAADRRERRAAEIERDRVLGQLRLQIERLPLAYILFDADHHVLDWNPAAETVFGYTKEETVGRPALDLVVPLPISDQVQDVLRRVMAGDMNAHSVNENRTKDGRIITCEWFNTPLMDPDGRYVGVISLAQDITEREQTEEALRESEGRFRGTFENAAVGIAHKDADGRFVRVNKKYCAIVGYTLEELVATTFQDITHPDDLELEIKKFAALMRGELPSYSLEKRYVHKDGSHIWIDVTVSLQRDAAGRPAYAIAILQDISERKHAEAALQLANARLDLAMRGSNIGIWEVDMPDGILENGRVTHLNLWEQLGFDNPASTTDVLDPQSMHPDDLERVRHAAHAYLSGETREFVVENRTRHKDGSYRWVLNRGVVVRDAAGKPVRFSGTLQDITEQKRQETDLRQAKEAAEAANRAKDEFLANVSHEIRTPFGAILGMTELVLNTPLTEDQRQCLETARSSAESLLGLVDDLLDFEKIEAGMLELDPADFSLRTVLGDTVRTLAPRAQTKGFELAWHVQPDVPDALVGDADRLRQVLLNLVGNAIKFTEKGEVVVQVEDAGAAGDGEVALRFAVRDTGIGIPPDGQERIFRAFEQVDTSTTRKHGGSGLGLTIASRLVAIMGGKITLNSEPGRGSTFAFTVRLRRQSSLPEPIATGLPTKESAQVLALAPPLRVLVAEDNEFNMRHLERLLTRRGHSVRLASNGRQALDLARVSPFDVLLLDLHMPELDGFQVVRAIREREKAAGGHLPVIALTARSRKEDHERCLAAGMDDYLAKPVRAPELFAAIERAVSGADASPPGLPPAAGGTSLLAATALLAACDGDAEGLREMCNDLQALAPGRLADVSGALRDQDAPRLREAAHKLCGLLSAFSTVAASVASDLEDHAARGQLDEARSLVGRLEVMVQELMQQVDGLSPESLRHQAGTAGDPNRTAGA